MAAVAAAVASWALVAVGGFVRAAESGLGCPDWPLCEGRAVPNASKEPVIEFSHRATAGVVTVLVLLVAVMAWRSYRSRSDLLIPALVALGLVPFQAVLGAIVVWLELPGWIVGLHFVVGMLFMAAAVAVAAAAYRGRAPAVTRGFQALVAWTVAAGLAVVVAGAVVVSRHADHACGHEWPLCNGTFVAGGADATVQVVHRVLAYAVAGLAVALVAQAARRRGPRAPTIALAVAVAAQLAVGIALVLAGEGRAHGPLEVLHVTGAGTVWALIVALGASTLQLPQARPTTRTVTTPAHP